jgi:predicted ArsR family transcriptional regulator
MSYKSGTSEVIQSKIPDEKKVTDSSAVPILFHEKKQIILKHLIEQDLNIMELKNLTKMNPGTIKRHLDDLVSKKLVFLSQTHKNAYGFNLKYYRATARYFSVHLAWP